MPWITAVLGAAVSRMLGFAMVFVSYMMAKRIAIVTGYLLASAALFLGMSGAIKAVVLGLRVSMPPMMAAVTYFLPSNINSFIAALVTVRLTHFIWKWTQSNLSVYANVGGYGEGRYF